MVVRSQVAFLCPQNCNVKRLFQVSAIFDFYRHLCDILLLGCGGWCHPQSGPRYLTVAFDGGILLAGLQLGSVIHTQAAPALKNSAGAVGSHHRTVEER